MVIGPMSSAQPGVGGVEDDALADACAHALGEGLEPPTGKVMAWRL
jgi:hypothetical protein